MLRSLVGSEMCIRDSPGQSHMQQHPASRQTHQVCQGSTPGLEGKPASKSLELQQWPQEPKLQPHYPAAPSSPPRPTGSRSRDSPASGRDHRPPSPDRGQQGQQQPPERSAMSPRGRAGSPCTTFFQATSPQTTPSPPWRPSKSATASPLTASPSCKVKPPILKKEDNYCCKKMKKDSNKFRKIFYMNSF